MAKPVETFKFTKELGRRLAELRRKAGLTQKQQAELMQGKKGHTQSSLSQLETGLASNPTLRLVADYLRACRASFDDIRDILNEYTRRPRVAEEKGRAAVRAMAENLPHDVARKVARYDAKTTVDRRFKGRLPEPPDKRLVKAQKLARSWIVRQRLEDRLHETLNRLGVPGPERRFLADYGRKVFGALRRTRGKDEDRASALLALRKSSAVGGRRLADSVRERLEHIETTVKELFDVLEQKGDLDRLPTAREAERLAGLPDRRRVRTDEQMHDHEFKAAAGKAELARFAFLDQTRAEARKLLTGLGVPPTVQSRYLSAVGQYLHIARHSEPGTERRRKMVDEYLARMKEKGCDPEIILRIGDLTLERLAPARGKP